MATKNCPKCNNQVQVACKKCSCGHTFFSARKGSSVSASGSGQSSSSGASTSKQEPVPESPVLRDRIPRERGRPVFYDAQELEDQMRKQKLLLKKQSKPQPLSSKSESTKVPSSKVPSTDDSDNGEACTRVRDHRQVSESGPDKQSQPKKRKRGRPPGITAKKRLSNPRSSTRILPRRKPPTNNNNSANNVSNHNEDSRSSSRSSTTEMKLRSQDVDDDIMSDLTPEKTLQLNIVLSEINRKLVATSWKA